MPETSSNPKFYALLIGINHYLPNHLPGGFSYDSLNGCVNDIGAIEACLRKKVTVTQVFKLISLASSDDPTKLAGPESSWPTKPNIKRLFQEVTALAQQGDQVFIYYSGHGGRAKTCFAEQKGANAYDEALVPPNVGNSTANYLRDLELAYLLQQMVNKGLVVSMVLDSCHSGGASRSGKRSTAKRGSPSPVKRGIGGPDERPFDDDGEAALVAPREELLRVWGTIASNAGVSAGSRPQAGTTRTAVTRMAVSRNAKPDSGWLPEPKGYVLLAACAPHQSAFEHIFEGSTYSGALSHWLLGALQQPLDAEMTYQMLYNRIKGQITNQFRDQTPMLQGDTDRVVFGLDVIPMPEDRINVLAVDLGDDPIRVQLDTGVGLNVGAQVALYAAQSGGQRLAVAKVVRISNDGLTSWADVVERFGEGEIEAGVQAVVIDPGAATLRSRVYLAQQRAGAPQKKALNAVSSAIQSDGKDWLTEANSPKADFQVTATAQGNFVIQDGAGKPIPVPSDIPFAKLGAVMGLVKRLIHFTRYNNVKKLGLADSDSTLRGKLSVELLRGRKDESPQPFDKEKRGQVQSEEIITLRIANRLPKTENDESANVLYLNFLNLQPDWGIKVLKENIEINPGETQMTSLKLTLPDGYNMGTDIFKIIATRKPHAFKHLTLPALDKPLLSERGDLVAEAALDWVVEQVEVSVVA